MTRTIDQIRYMVVHPEELFLFFAESLCLLSGTNTRHNDVLGNNSSVDILLG